jgi:hypothetical protein
MIDPGTRGVLEAPLRPALLRLAFRTMLVLSWFLPQERLVAAEAAGAVP